MGKLKFDDVDLLLIEPDISMRTNVKNILYDQGFRDLRMGGTAAYMRDEINQVPPDLLISDVKLPDGNFCGFVYELRHHLVGTNPFLPVIAVGHSPDHLLVGEVIESGADDFLSKPLSAVQLGDRIRALVNHRKPFLVTTDYIGPDRRQSAERESTVPLLEVPNPLKAKATGQPEVIDLEQTIREVNLRKLERHSDQISYLIEVNILPLLERGITDGEVRESLDRLLYVTQDTNRRLAGTKYDHVSDLCRSLTKVTADICATGHPSATDVKLLRPLAQAIKTGFDNPIETAATAREISATVMTEHGGE